MFIAEENLSAADKVIDSIEQEAPHPGIQRRNAAGEVTTALSGKLLSGHSVDQLEYRITLDLLIQDGPIILINVGYHDSLN